MKVEVITVPDCPHREATVAHVRTALGDLGRKDVVVTEREVDEADEAAAAELRGSPTVLVDGADLFGGCDEPSLSCRLGPPSVASLVDAFQARRSATIGRAGFAALWRGEQPLVDELGDGDRAVIDQMAAAGRIEWDESGRLTGVHGLTTRPTAHRIEHGSGPVHTWCALDAIGIPAALGIDAVAVTRCPTCRAEMRVRIERGVPVDGESLRLWLPSSDCEHLVNDFCQHANLYCSDAHVPSRAAPAGRTIAVAEAAAIGRQVWRDVSVPHHRHRRRIGWLGSIARVIVGSALLLDVAVGHWNGPFRPAAWITGLVIFPALVAAWGWWRARRGARRLAATGPDGHALNAAIFLALYLSPLSDAALIFYGASMLLAAARGYAGCEVLAVSNVLHGRDDEVGCALFAPVDALERRR